MSRKMIVGGPGWMGEDCAHNLVSTEWLSRQNSALIWSEEILISKYDYADALSPALERNDPFLFDTITTILNSLKDEGVIRIVDPKKIVPAECLDAVDAQVDRDLELYGSKPEKDADTGLVDPAAIEVGDCEYCNVMVMSIYYNLLLSRLMGYPCLLDDYEMHFVKSFVMKHFRKEIAQSDSGLRTFNNLYSVMMPAQYPFNGVDIFCAAETRNSCARNEICTKDRQANTRKYIDRIMLMRSNPDILSLAKTIDKLEKELGPDEIAINDAIQRDIRKAQQKVYSRYSSWRNWTRFIETASTVSFSIVPGETPKYILPAIAAASFFTDVYLAKLQKAEHWKIMLAEGQLQKPF